MIIDRDDDRRIRPSNREKERQYGCAGRHSTNATQHSSLRILQTLLDSTV